MAAVEAAFAAAHDGAATVAVRHTGRAGAPVAGSTTWWRVSAPRVHRRTVVLDVARPPDRMATTGPGPSSGCRWWSPMVTGHPSSGGGPATAMSPPRLTSTPQPAADAALPA